MVPASRLILRRFHKNEKNSSDSRLATHVDHVIDHAHPHADTLRLQSACFYISHLDA